MKGDKVRIKTKYEKDECNEYKKERNKIDKWNKCEGNLTERHNEWKDEEGGVKDREKKQWIKEGSVKERIK